MHTSSTTLDCTSTTTGDFHPSNFRSNSLLRGTIIIRLSDGEFQKLKWAKIPLSFRKGKLGTVNVNVRLKSQYINHARYRRTHDNTAVALSSPVSPVHARNAWDLFCSLLKREQIMSSDAGKGQE